MIILLIYIIVGFGVSLLLKIKNPDAWIDVELGAIVLFWAPLLVVLGLILLAKLIGEVIIKLSERTNKENK